MESISKGICLTPTKAIVFDSAIEESCVLISFVGFVLMSNRYEDLPPAASAVIPDVNYI